MSDFRIGIGYDVHGTKKGSDLYLGGVLIPHEFGLEGYSDADVLIHAIADALLGAACMGDIGTHFPTGDERYKNMPGKELLSSVYELVRGKYSISNIDSTIIIQTPRIAGYIEQMRRNISSTLKLNIKCVSVKATTTDKLGFIGKNKGAAAEAVVLLCSK